MGERQKRAAKKEEKKSTTRKKAISKRTTKKTIDTVEERLKKETSFPIIGIGASAGGLEALEGFIRHITPRCNMAFVIIQHRATESKSIMVSLLEKYSELKVFEITDGMKIQPESIYINQPHKDISITNGKFYCDNSDDAYGTRLPIDYFFKSLANNLGERSICIILSGTGSDGTLGMKEIKAAGGLAMAQEEKQAKYFNMPRSAIDTGLVDFILPVEKMPDKLMQYVKHPYLETHRRHEAAVDKFETYLQQIFGIMRTITGHDFSNYKRNTIQRRIQRRMAVHQISDIKEYIRFLRENTKEVKALFKDMIITVTNFFRDSDAFKALKEKAIKEIIRSKPLNSSIRIWIPGCATGEEAYSVAMLLEETLEEMKKKMEVQIFATDLDVEVIDTARYGRYPDSISADISHKFLKKYFVRLDNSYKIKEQIREKLVFAKQDLIKDPPFSKLDLICCRNVLIYMNQDLQKKIIPLFHYTLNPNGFLFLGTSETIGQFSDLFSPVDTKQKIFSRKSNALRHHEYPVIQNVIEFAGQSGTQEKQQKNETDISRLAINLILKEYSLPCVLLNEKYDIIYFHGDTGAFLVQPGGEPTTNILKMAKREFHYPLSILLHKAEREEKTAISENMQVKYDNEMLNFNLIVRPVKEWGIKENLLMVVFDIKPQKEISSEKVEKKAKIEHKIPPRIEALEQELKSTKEYLQTTIEELETSNEELKSSNEELQSTNEELQSTNEELETSREELQSTNEELRTVNSEHQSKIDELFQVNDDLNNLLASTNIATVFLDTELKIKRFTPESRNLFKFIESDTGRPLDNIVNKLEYVNLEADMEKVLKTLEKIECEVQTKDGLWLLVKIAPYRTTENVIDGVVITIFDISKEKEAQRYAESIFEMVRQPMLVLDKELKVLSANRAFYRTFAAKSQETEGKFIYDIGNGQWDIPKLRKLLKNILSKNTFFEDFEVEYKFPGIDTKKMILNARCVSQEGKRTEFILMAIEKIT
ncbi:MAG: PAS domain-containing protein [Sedimentisphaerales bacterium]|nr:PAS domain-containing protein [Sedimentisphaerales bacterium]